MTSSNNPYIGAGIRAAKFPTAGTSITGTILAETEEQRRDFDTRKPLVDKNGNPVTQPVFILETRLRDDDADDGLRRLYITARMQQALQRAALLARRDHIGRGDQITVTHTRMAGKARDFTATLTPASSATTKTPPDQAAQP